VVNIFRTTTKTLGVSAVKASSLPPQTAGIH
jgi:hypothetical protein